MLEDFLMIDQLDFLEILSLAHFGYAQEVTTTPSFLNATQPLSIEAMVQILHRPIPNRAHTGQLNMWRITRRRMHFP